MAKDITLFTSPTAKRVLDNLNKGGSGRSGGPALNPLNSLTIFQSNFAKVLNATASKPGFYDMRVVVWDDTDADIANHDWADVSPVVNIEAKEISGAEGIDADEVFRIELRASKEGPMWYFQQGGGGVQVYATSPNTTFDASFTYGATANEPSATVGDFTALTIDASFKLTTPWNTAVTAPNKLFGWWNKVGDNYYTAVDKFYVKPSATYSAVAGTGITTFTAYWNRVATHSLGTNTAFPSGIKLLLDGFDAVNASSDSRAYFNGQIFSATYDSANNIIYIEHPLVG